MSTTTVFTIPLALQGGQGPLGAWASLVPMLVIFAIFYFVLVMPMRKRQKALQAVIENLKRGDRVVTTGGLYGEVAAVEPSYVLLKVADNVKLKVAKSADRRARGGGGQRG